MMPRRRLLPALRMAFWAVLLWLMLPGQSAQAQANPKAAASAPSPGTSNTALVDPPVTPSVFLMPSGPKEGKDPFFPHSSRPYASRVIQTNQVAVPIVADLRLNGISGPPEKRLAIINFKTFEAGEEAEVNTNAGRIRLRCIEIQADAVIIQIGGERRLLRLRPGS
jgi:hypothetical protein